MHIKRTSTQNRVILIATDNDLTRILNRIDDGTIDPKYVKVTTSNPEDANAGQITPYKTQKYMTYAPGIKPPLCPEIPATRPLSVSRYKWDKAFNQPKYKEIKTVPRAEITAICRDDNLCNYIDTDCNIVFNLESNVPCIEHIYDKSEYQSEYHDIISDETMAHFSLICQPNWVNGKLIPNESTEFGQKNWRDVNKSFEKVLYTMHQHPLVSKYGIDIDIFTDPNDVYEQKLIMQDPPEPDEDMPDNVPKKHVEIREDYSLDYRSDDMSEES